MSEIGSIIGVLVLVVIFYKVIKDLNRVETRCQECNGRIEAKIAKMREKK